MSMLRAVRPGRAGASQPDGEDVPCFVSQLGDVPPHDINLAEHKLDVLDFLPDMRSKTCGQLVGKVREIWWRVGRRWRCRFDGDALTDLVHDLGSRSPVARILRQDFLDGSLLPRRRPPHLHPIRLALLRLRIQLRRLGVDLRQERRLDLQPDPMPRGVRPSDLEILLIRDRERLVGVESLHETQHRVQLLLHVRRSSEGVGTFRRYPGVDRTILPSGDTGRNVYVVSDSVSPIDIHRNWRLILLLLEFRRLYTCLSVVFLILWGAYLVDEIRLDPVAWLAVRRLVESRMAALRTGHVVFRREGEELLRDQCFARAFEDSLLLRHLILSRCVGRRVAWMFCSKLSKTTWDDLIRWKACFSTRVKGCLLF